MPQPIKVELHPHSPAWAEFAKREAARIAAALGDNLIVVHHIGSTSIPGIHAKPIIDLLPEVRSLAELDAAAPRLTALGYRYCGEYGIPGRRYCALDDPLTGQRRYQLHCFAAGSPQIVRHLAFRDYLRAHPEVAREYDAEKHRCRLLHPDDSHAYSEAKSAWIQACLPPALAYHASLACLSAGRSSHMKPPIPVADNPTDTTFEPAALIEAYERGCHELRAAVDGMSGEQLRARPVSGLWSTLEVVCHIADCEQFFAERMKRTLAMERPLLVGADGGRYPEPLAYQQRAIEEELELTALTRRQMARILRLAPADSWQRSAVHTEAGLITLHQLVVHAVDHLRHHLRFIAEKRTALRM